MTITAVDTMLHTQPVQINHSKIEFSTWIAAPDTTERRLVSRMYIKSGDLTVSPIITRDALLALRAAIDEHLVNLDSTERLFAELNGSSMQEVQP